MAKPRRSHIPNQLSPEREREILTAARKVFVEKGYGAASAELIAKKAGVSKTALYRRYNNKGALFTAVMQQAADLLAGKLDAIELDPHRPIECLHNAAYAIRDGVSGEHVEITRLMVAEAKRYPDLSQQAREKMLGVLVTRMERFFKTLIKRGQMDHPYPHQAAMAFVLLFSRGFRPLFPARISVREDNRRVEADFGMFLRGCSIQDPKTRQENPESIDDTIQQPAP